MNIGVTQRKLSREATFKHILLAQSSIQRSDKARIEGFFFSEKMDSFFFYLSCVREFLLHLAILNAPFFGEIL